MNWFDSVRVFPCPSCGGDVHDYGSYASGYCCTCGIFFHCFGRLMSNWDPHNDPYGWVPSWPDPRAIDIWENEGGCLGR